MRDMTVKKYVGQMEEDISRGSRIQAVLGGWLVETEAGGQDIKDKKRHVTKSYI